MAMEIFALALILRVKPGFSDGLNAIFWKVIYVFMGSHYQ
jgi:hypothetical protein